jgi:hypothetical protein
MMKQIVSLFIAFGLCQSFFAQKIVKAEYFINDSDKGFGNNTPIVIAPANQNEAVGLNLNLSLSNAEMGIHNLFIRVQDENKRWSMAALLPFQVIPVQNSYNITKAEYYIDSFTVENPGTNIAIGSLTSNSTITCTIDLNNVSPGLHTLYTRVKDSNNQWSIVNCNLFYLIPSNEIAKVKSFEYYFEGISGSTGTYTFNNFNPGLVVELKDADFLANVSELEYDKQYTLHIRALNDNGRYSGYSTLQFTFKEIGTGLGNPLSSGLTMYPNPASDFLYINGGELTGALYYFIYNNQGQSLANGIVEEERINIQSLPAGNYILVIKEGTTIHRGDFFMKK